MYACVFINLAFAAITATSSSLRPGLGRPTPAGKNVEANNVEGNNVDVGAYGLSAVKSIHVQSGWYIASQVQHRRESDRRR